MFLCKFCSVSAPSPCVWLSQTRSTMGGPTPAAIWPLSCPLRPWRRLDFPIHNCGYPTFTQIPLVPCRQKHSGKAQLMLAISHASVPSSANGEPPRPFLSTDFFGMYPVHLHFGLAPPLFTLKAICSKLIDQALLRIASKTKSLGGG